MDGWDLRQSLRSQVGRLRMTRLCLLLGLSLVLVGHGVCASSDPKTVRTIVDDLGIEHEISGPVDRIISLAPHLTEILFALGAGDRIVGTVMYADYPPAAMSIPRFGDAFNVSVESVVATKPDLVFAWATGGSSRSIDRIRTLGIPVYMSEPGDLQQLLDGIERIGVAIDDSGRAKMLTTRFRQRLKEIGSNDRHTSVFFQISDQSLYTVNGEHLIGHAINHCGGTNVFEHIQPSVPQVSKEAVLAAKPDLVLITHLPGSLQSDWFATWRGYPNVIRHVEGIDPNLISRAGPRLLQGIERMCELIETASADHDME